MTIRIRKLVGTIALLILVAAWSLGWVIPAMMLVRWMARPDSPTQR